MRSGRRVVGLTSAACMHGTGWPRTCVRGLRGFCLGTGLVGAGAEVVRAAVPSCTPRASSPVQNGGRERSRVNRVAVPGVEESRAEWTDHGHRVFFPPEDLPIPGDKRDDQINF
jgi:hypothetical protein